MFGMGMGELVLILVVALLVVGPDKLPQAAKAIGRGIRDFRRHSQDLQSTLEQDEKLGEAVRELKSALRDDPLRWRPNARQSTVPTKPAAKPGSSATEAASTAATGAAATAATGAATSASTASAAAASSAESDAPPTVVPAAGAVAKQPSSPRDGAPPDARPDPRPGTNRSTEADDPAHG
jgi:sec-independent protein translocase protein TatB